MAGRQQAQKDLQAKLERELQAAEIMDSERGLVPGSVHWPSTIVIPKSISLIDSPPDTALLEFRWDQGTRKRGNLSGCLWAFILLPEMTQEAIVGFAKRWGPLGLPQPSHVAGQFPAMSPATRYEDFLRHSREGPSAGSAWANHRAAVMPSFQHRVSSPEVQVDDESGPIEIERFVPKGWETPKRELPQPVQRESLDDWRRRAEHLRALLLVAANLYRGVPGDREEWTAIGQEWPPDRDDYRQWADLMRAYGYNPDAWERQGGPLLAEHAALSRAVLDWLALGRLVPVPSWPGGRLRLEVLAERMAGLACVLAGQLIAVLEAPVGPYRCCACKRPYVPERQPRGEWYFCRRPDCGRRASNRTSARERRAGIRPPRKYVKTGSYAGKAVRARV